MRKSIVWSEGSVMMTTNSVRKDWIDFARAFGIFCIAYGHLVQGESYVSLYFGSFRVAIFFLIMGLTFSLDSSFISFLKKKAKRLLVPYFVFALLSILVLYSVAFIVPALSEYKSTSVVLYLWGAIYGNGLTGNMKWNLPLWFLPCSFITLLFVFGFEKLISTIKANKFFLRILYVLISAIITFLYVYFIRSIKLPFGTEVAIPMSGFVELGILMSKIDGFKCKYIYALISIPLIILGCFLGLNNGVVSVTSLLFGVNLVVYYISAISTIVGFICLFIWLCSVDVIFPVRKAVCYSGKHTLAILCMHKFPIVLFQQVIPYTRTLFRAEARSMQKDLLGLLVTIIVILLCLIVELPINRFIPFVFGSSNAKGRAKK